MKKKTINYTKLSKYFKNIPLKPYKIYLYPNYVLNSTLKKLFSKNTIREMES